MFYLQKENVVFNNLHVMMDVVSILAEDVMVDQTVKLVKMKVDVLIVSEFIFFNILFSVTSKCFKKV